MSWIFCSVACNALSAREVRSAARRSRQVGTRPARGSRFDRLIQPMGASSLLWCPVPPRTTLSPRTHAAASGGRSQP